MKHSFRFVFLVMGTTLFLIISGCDLQGDESTYSIGDIGPSGVGIVFYVTDGGNHGLEAAPEDQNDGNTMSWITGGDTQTTANGNTATDIGAGPENSEAIIAQEGHAESAAQICRSYRSSEEGDWFLPSHKELNELFLHKDAVGGIDSFYWSSSEWDASQAYIMSSYNTSVGNSKGNSYKVRAIRAF